VLIAFANAFENVSKISRDRAGRWRLWPEGRQRRCALKLLLRMTLQVKGPGCESNGISYRTII